MPVPLRKLEAPTGFEGIVLTFHPKLKYFTDEVPDIADLKHLQNQLKLKAEQHNSVCLVVALATPGTTHANQRAAVVYNPHKPEELQLSKGLRGLKQDILRVPATDAFRRLLETAEPRDSSRHVVALFHKDPKAVYDLHKNLQHYDSLPGKIGEPLDNSHWLYKIQTGNLQLDWNYPASFDPFDL